MGKTDSIRTNFLHGLEYFFILCFSILIAGFYIYGIHGALQNIVFGLLGGTLLLRYILIGKFELYLPWKTVLAYGLIYLVFVLIFQINFYDGSVFARSCSNKVLILLFPLIFAFYPLQKTRVHFFYFWMFITFTLIECAWASYNYYLDFTGPRLHTWSSVIHVYLIPFRIMHHHLGVLVDCAILLLVYMIDSYTRSKRYLSICISILCIVALVLFLHLLGARLSLAIFYLSLLLIFGYYAIKINKLYLNIGMVVSLLVLCLFFVFSVNKMDTLSKKINETYVDFNSIVENGPSPNHNISGRIYSDFIAVDFIKNRPWQGYGYYNYEKIFAEYYAKYHPDYREDIRLLPPNQFLRYFVCLGVPLALILMFSFVLPLLLNKNYLKVLLLGFYAIIFIYCMVEFPLEDNNFFYFFSFSGPWLLHFYASISSNKETVSQI